MAATVDEKLVKSTKFPPEFSQKVDMQKVNITVLKKWIAGRIADILGEDDDIVIEMCFNLLEEKRFPDIKRLQIQLTAFLFKDAAIFCKELWNLCLSAQSSPQGVAKELLEAKKEELKQEKIQAEKAAAEAKRRSDFETARERDIEGIRQRERDDRSRGRPGFGRGRRDWDRRPPRRSRSPARALDTYVPSAVGRRRDDRHARRSPSRSRTPKRSPGRSPAARSRSRSPPPRRARQRSATRSRSRDRSKTRHRRRRSPSRSRSPPRKHGKKSDRFEDRDDEPRRPESSPPRRRPHSPKRPKHRSPSTSRSRSRSRRPRRHYRSKGRRDSRSSSRSPRPRRRSGSPSRRPERRPSLSSSGSRSQERNGFHGADSPKSDRDSRSHSNSRGLSRSRSRSRSPPRKRRRSMERYEPRMKRRVTSPDREDDGRRSRTTSSPESVDKPTTDRIAVAHGLSSEETKAPNAVKVSASVLREKLLKEKLILRRKSDQRA